MTCVLCNERLLEDAALYELNPRTNRYAIMHTACWQDAYDELSEDEKDRYQQRKTR